MARRRKTPNVHTRADDSHDTPQPAAKRQKTASEQYVSRSKQPRFKSAVREAAPTRPTTAKSAPHRAATTTTKSKRSFRPEQEKLRPPRKPPAKPKPRGLLSLPIETKQRIFLYMSARDTARLRRVCKTLELDVRGSTKYIAKLVSREEMERIQQQVDGFVSLKPRTDFDSLMKALHVWTKQRGVFDEGSVQSQSLTACLASSEFEEGRTDVEHFYLAITGLGLLDYNDCDKLFESVKHPKLRLSGRLWPTGTREQTTFPERMTPLLQYPLWGEHDPLSDEYDEQTNAFVDYLAGRPSMPLLEATHGNAHLIDYLRLPALSNEVSCYYLDANWARREANKHLDRVAIKATPVRVSPLLIAAILESVMLF